MTVEIAGGTFTGGVLELSAAGVGGGGAGSATGTGGTATFTQTGGAVTISDMDIVADGFGGTVQGLRSEEHTSELQSLMRNSYAVFCLKKKKEENENTESNIQRENDRQHIKHITTT